MQNASTGLGFNREKYFQRDPRDAVQRLANTTFVRPAFPKRRGAFFCRGRPQGCSYRPLTIIIYGLPGFGNHATHARARRQTRRRTPRRVFLRVLITRMGEIGSKHQPAARSRRIVN